MFAQVAVDTKSSQGNVTIMQKKNVSVASKLRSSLRHTQSNLPLAHGEVSGCAFPFS